MERNRVKQVARKVRAKVSRVQRVLRIAKEKRARAKASMARVRARRQESLRLEEMEPRH